MECLHQGAFMNVITQNILINAFQEVSEFLQSELELMIIITWNTLDKCYPMQTKLGSFVSFIRNKIWFTIQVHKYDEKWSPTSW